MTTSFSADGGQPFPIDPAFWEGRQRSYRPAPDWLDRVAPRLELHREADAHVDPVTYEVIRNRLWTTNLAVGETLQRISGSPVFQSLDFNMCILTEDAEIVTNGPFIIYLAMGAPLAIPYIMEHFSDQPGIEEGDVFLVSDPWIGASHQMDVLLAAPVFVEGKLFGWVSNAAHQYDLGGIVPGGWPQNAPDIFHDPIVFPPFKIVERGVLRQDLEQMYRRQSRMPQLVGLDLRAQIGGIHYAVREILAMCDQFGATTVKGAMRKVLDDAQRGFAEKLRRIPDGTWSETRFIDEKMPGDTNTYRVQLNITKTGDRLVVDNTGTDPQQEGPIGITFVSFSGAVVGSIGVSMLYEHLFAVGGASRQIDYDVTPGTITISDYPAPIAGGVMTIVNMINSLMSIISRMLMCDPDLRRDIIGTQTEFPLLVLAGVDDRGNQIGTGLFEATAQGSGGKHNRDGVDTTGMAWSPLMKLLNMESVEGSFPLVYLYRRERLDGGGLGRYRGGTGMDFAFTPYRAEHIVAITNVGGQAVSTHGVKGLFGGYPVPTTTHIVRKNTNLGEFLSNSRIPGDVDELCAAENVLLRGKSNGTLLGAGDVVQGSFGGGGGYGDPLERDLDSAQHDLDLGYISAVALHDICGIVVDDAGRIDDAATSRRRKTLLDERASWTPADRDAHGSSPVAPATGEPDQIVHEYIVARDVGADRVLACARCETVLSGYRGNYKLGMLMHEGPVTLIPGVGDPNRFLACEMVFRRFCCPDCHVLAATEIAKAGDPVQAECIFT